MQNSRDLEFEEANQLFRYDPESGKFYWATRSVRKCPVGTEAGKKARSTGYKFIKVRGRAYAASRLAWLLMTGTWPKLQIDHINRNPSDNSWANLREATQSQNNANRPSRKTRDLPKGVRQLRSCQKYQANISIRNKPTSLGTFWTMEEAHQAYMAKARELHGDFALEF